MEAGWYSAAAGQAACLGAALLWALAVSMFRSAILAHGARAVNLVKCLLAAALQGLTVVALGQAGSLWTAPGGALALVALSGVIGLVVGDTALFGSVARIGPHRTLLLQTLAPVFAGMLAAVWPGELPSARQGFGAAVILAGVAIVVAPDRKRARVRLDERDWSTGGIALGVLAAAGQGTGIVLAKAGMAEIPVLPASFVRLLAAGVGLAVIGRFDGSVRRAATLVRAREDLRVVVPATLLGTYLALFLMMAGVALAPAAVAAVLLASSPIFGLVLEAVIERRPVRARGIVGTLLSLIGVAVLGGA